MDWLAQAIEATIQAVEAVAALATGNPMGLMVVLLVASNVWSLRRIQQAQREIRSLTRALIMLEAGHDLDESTQRLLRRRNNR